MKRSKAIREILKVLKTWEGSRLERRTANEVLSKLEELGVMPPYSSELVTSEGCKGLVKNGYAWDHETKRKRRKK